MYILKKRDILFLFCQILGFMCNNKSQIKTEDLEDQKLFYYLLVLVGKTLIPHEKIISLIVRVSGVCRQNGDRVFN